jgi:hypothetical protein
MSRPNFSKKGKTPQQILLEDRPKVNLELMLYPVIDLDAEFRQKFNLRNREGQHLHVSPANSLENSFCLEALKEALLLGKPEIFNSDLCSFSRKRRDKNQHGW